MNDHRNNTNIQDVPYKGIPMDMLLKELAIDKWRDAIDYAIHGKYKECFYSYRALFYLIEPYDFPLKATLSELNDVIDAYLESLQGKPADSKAMITFSKTTREFKQLLQIYMSQLPKAYAELGVWFKVNAHHKDFDLLVSDENFSSELTLLENKRKELGKLEKSKILDLMRPKAIHDVYAAWRIENAV